MKLTPEELIAMARQADFFKDGFDQWVGPNDAGLVVFASLVAARTREECAKAIETHQATWQVGAEEFARVIRAMGERT